MIIGQGLEGAVWVGHLVGGLQGDLVAEGRDPAPAHRASATLLSAPAGVCRRPAR